MAGLFFFATETESPRLRNCCRACFRSVRCCSLWRFEEVLNKERWRLQINSCRRSPYSPKSTYGFSLFVSLFYFLEQPFAMEIAEYRERNKYRRYFEKDFRCAQAIDADVTTHSTTVISELGSIVCDGDDTQETRVAVLAAGVDSLKKLSSRTVEKAKGKLAKQKRYYLKVKTRAWHERSRVRIGPRPRFPATNPSATKASGTITSATNPPVTNTTAPILPMMTNPRAASVPIHIFPCFVTHSTGDRVTAVPHTTNDRVRNAGTT